MRRKRTASPGCEDFVPERRLGRFALREQGGHGATSNPCVRKRSSVYIRCIVLRYGCPRFLDWDRAMRSENVHFGGHGQLATAGGFR